MRDDGNIEFLARIDDQVKFRGFRIELAEIQSVLERHPNIIKAELILRKVKNENKLVAYYVSKNKKEIEKHLLREFVISHLPEYMLPSLFINLDEIPLTNNGKVNKKALAKIDRHQGAISCVGIDPKSRYVFSGGEDGKTFVLDIKSGKLAFTLPGHVDTINDIAFSYNMYWKIS